MMQYDLFVAFTIRLRPLENLYRVVLWNIARTKDSEGPTHSIGYDELDAGTLGLEDSS